MAARPTNKEDVEQIVATDEVVKDAMPDGPVCPSIPGLIFDKILPPEAQQILSLINTGAELAAAALAQRTKVPPTEEEVKQEINSTFSSAVEKVTQTGTRLKDELGRRAEDIKASAWEAYYSTANSASLATRAVRDGIINIGTDLEDIDEVTMNAIEREFPGYKSIRECLAGGVEGSSVVESGTETANEQVSTPPPPNPAEVKANLQEDNAVPVESGADVSTEDPIEPEDRAAIELAKDKALAEQKKSMNDGTPLKIDLDAPLDLEKIARDRQESIGGVVVTPSIFLDGDVYHVVFPQFDTVISYFVDTGLKSGTTTKRKVLGLGLVTPPQYLLLPYEKSIQPAGEPE